MASPPDVFERAQHAFAELGARVRVREELAGGDEVRLDQRAPVRLEPELVEAFAHDVADRLPDRSSRSCG